MLSLFVYNRNIENANKLNRKCVSHIKNSGRELEKNECFCDPVTLCASVNTFDHVSLYMLRKDKKLDRIAENIRNANEGNYIILVLGSPEELFGAVTPSARPSGILPEEPDDNQVATLIDQIYADHSRMEKLSDRTEYCFKLRGTDYKIGFNKIMVIEVQNKRIKFYTASQCIEFYDSLEAVMKSAPEYFLRIHRSILVNTNYIKMVNYREKSILMQDGSVQYFSRTYSNDIKEYMGNTLKENFF